MAPGVPDDLPAVIVEQEESGAVGGAERPAPARPVGGPAPPQAGAPAETQVDCDEEISGEKPDKRRRVRLPPRWGPKDYLILVIVALLAAGLRFPRLAEPAKLVFDETYYAKDACLYLGHSPQFCRVDQSTEQSYVHPPLGKWLIALGIWGFGYDSFGWRFSALVAGVLVVVLVFALARKLFANRWAAGAAGVLASTDFLLIVQSRTAMLDIFLALFVLLGFFFLACDRARILAIRAAADPAAAAKEPAGSEPDEASLRDFSSEKIVLLGKGAAGRGRWLRIAAGVSFGLALSVKWSSVWALVAGFLMACAWSAGLLRSMRRNATVVPEEDPAGSGPPAGASRAAGPRWGRELAATLTAMALLPAVVYLAVYSPYYADRLDDECPYTVPAAKENRFFGEGTLGLEAGRCVEGVAGAALSFADLQDRMLDYHLNLTAKHSYQSKAWTWPLVLRPVAYFYETPGGKPVHILGFGNPITWWAAIGAALWLAAKSLRRWSPERVILAAWGAQYLPWLTVSRPLFFFYMTPIVPFMMMGLAGMLWSARSSGKLMRRLVNIYLFIGVGLATYYFYPVLAAIALSQDLWESRMWFKAFDCGRFKCGWI